MSKLKVFPMRHFGDLARAVARLASGEGGGSGKPGAGVRERTVLVAGEPVAHALRRELLRIGQGTALGGTRMIGTVTAARAVLEAAGLPAGRADEAALRPLRLRALFEEELPLAYFDRERLRADPGWDEAFGKSIGALESAALRPGDLETREVVKLSPRARDLALVWRRLEELTAAGAAPSFSAARDLARAAEALRADPSRWPFAQPVLATVSSVVTTAEADFLRALPGLHLGVQRVRPARDESVTRLGALFGAEAARAAVVPGESAARAGRLARLQERLFDAGETQANRAAPAPDDQAVTLEEYAGVAEEIEAAADWVARLIDTRACGLEDIAIVHAGGAELAGLLADRLAALGTAASPVGVYVAGGLPVVRLAAGARLLKVLQTLRAGLPIAELAALLPWCKCAADEGSAPAGAAPHHLSLAESARLLNMMGTTGGHAERLSGGLAWAERLAITEARLRAVVAHGEPPPADKTFHDQRAQARALDSLRAVQPALRALVDLLAELVRPAPLGQWWPKLRGFCEQHLLLPGAGARLPALLDAALRPLIDDPLGAKLPGAAAVEAVCETLLGLHTTAARFGSPAVFIGTIDDARRLPFAAVRVLGLAEGTLPAAASEDPVLPEVVRRRWAPALLTPEQRLAGQWHAFAQLCDNTRDTLVLSFPRRTLDGSEREPASVLLDVALAVGDGVVPDSRTLARDFFVPARRSATQARLGRPWSAAAWLDRSARRRTAAPADWDNDAALDLRRMRQLASAPHATALDGFFPAVTSQAGDTLPGLTPDRALSASKLKILLECPHRFLLESLLGLRVVEPAAAHTSIDFLSYGKLLHTVHEEFFTRHGRDFSARRGRIEDHLQHALDLADQALRDLLAGYPLEGELARAQAKEILWRDVKELLRREFSRPARNFVATERGFGYDAPVVMTSEAPAGVASEAPALFVHGFIDRIETEGPLTVISDLKTAMVKRRQPEEPPDPSIDSQMAVYLRAAARLAATWGTPAATAGAYVYVTQRGDGERAFVDDAAQLHAAGAHWAAVAAGLLATRQFPRTTQPEDCRYCSFKVACGPQATARAAALGRAHAATGDAHPDGARSALTAFFELKGAP